MDQRVSRKWIMEGNSDEFVARPYQIDKPYTKGGKHTVFSVNTVALDTQQSTYMARLIELTCGEFSVDKNVDFWTRDIWENELEENQSLEITFRAKVAAINSAMRVKNYATPEEIIVEYNEYDIPHVGKQINDVINEIEDVLKAIVLKSSLKCITSSEACGPKTVNKKLTSILRDIQEQFANSGVYGASKAVLLHLIQLECIKNYAREEAATNVLGYFITELIKFRKLLEDGMKDVTDVEKIHKYSSDQVRKLFTVLKNFHSNKCTHKKFSCIIFVQQQCTANVLHHILKNLSTHDEEFKFLQSDFLAGLSNNPYKNSRESLCISKWNRQVLLRFKNGLSNCIIASDVMEEGIDIPTCRLIVRYNGY